MALPLSRLRYTIPSLILGAANAARLPRTAHAFTLASLQFFQSNRTTLVPAVAFSGIWSLLPSIWESILRAVPKKKTTHSRTRSRQLAGKALKDVTALNTCSGCGRIKKMHTLCPHCVQSVREMLREQTKSDNAEPKEEQK